MTRPNARSRAEHGPTPTASQGACETTCACADADAIAAGRDDGASAKPRVVADFELAELHRVFFDESEMAIEEKRVRRKAIERVVAEQDQHTGRDGDVAADGDSCGK